MHPARGWLPHPILSAALLVLWMLLWQSASPGIVALGLVLAVVVPLWSRAFWPDRPNLRRATALVRFVPLFVWDVVIANVVVAWLILDVRRRLRPTWLVVPLDLEDSYAITTLANVISLTPGTVSSQLSPDRRKLLVHALDVADSDAVVARIKSRYEARIKAIFE